MMKVKNGVLSMNREEMATIARDAINKFVDDSFDEDESHQKTVSYPVQVQNGADVLNVENVNFSLDCASDINDDRYNSWKEQRNTRGFDDTELWNLDNTILRFILPRLKAFKEITHGFPANIESYEKWQSMLDEMIFAIEWYLDEDKDEFVRDEHDNYVRGEDGDLVLTEEHKRAKAGWKVFSENFFGLWD